MLLRADRPAPSVAIYLVALVMIASGWAVRAAPELRWAAAPQLAWDQGISPRQASALALNHLAATTSGFQLSNPRHTATFTPSGLVFRATDGPDWRWQLRAVTADNGAPVAEVDLGTVVPLRQAPDVVAYRRGGLVEQYVAHMQSVEQQFVIPQPLDLSGADLVIAGTVWSNGAFEATSQGWAWRTEGGVVSLGNVYVYDAGGQTISARMHVAAGSTEIVVDGAALQHAAYPVTIDPEVGTNDFRISDIGPNNTAGYEAFQSKVAYNSATDQYLVVWRGDEQADLQAEIYGQLIDAATGAEVGTNDFLVARVGTAGDPATDAIKPAVAYNSVRNEFLVVFAGDNAPDPPPLIVDTFEIYGQRIAANGSLVGGQVRLSDLGVDDANGSYDANDPAIAYNPGADEYLVVWAGDDNTAPLINNELEIWGQMVGYSAGNLVEVGTNDIRISSMGATDGNGSFDAREPSVAYNSAANEYLVVWAGNDAVAQPSGAFEIFGQRLSAAGLAVGTDDFLLGDAGDEAYTPDVAYNSTDNQYLVVWEGDNGAGNDFEIYGQLLNGTGGEVGVDFQISDAGSSASFLAQTPAVAYNSALNEYLVVWRGEDDFGGLIDGEFEAFGKRLNAAGSTIEGTLRLSNMGPNGAVNSSTQTPDVAYSDSGLNNYLVVWAAENQPTTAPNELEIWGQLVGLRYDLQITKSVSPSNPAPGEAVTYTITYVNAGPDRAVNVVITDLVPADVTSPSFTTSGVTGSPPVLRGGTTYIWDVAQLNSGQGGTITINGTVGALANGTVVANTASIAAAAISESTPGNNSQTANFTVNTPPTVTMSSAVPNPTNTSPIAVTAQFSENVTGFTAADIVAGNATVNNFVAVDGDTYTFNLVPSGQGLVTADIPAGVAQDGGGKGNLAATEFSRTYDSLAPAVTVNQAAGQADPTTNSPVNFTVLFAESVTGFTSADVTLSGTAGATTAVVSGSGTTYNVAVSGMSTNGTVIATIAAGVATDAAGNTNSPSTSTDNTVTFVTDTTPPNVALSSAATNPTNTSPIAVTAQFSENVTGFTAADIVAGNATVNNFVAVDGDTYTFNLVPSGQGLVTADIPAGVATDIGGNPNTAAAQFSRTFDSIVPTVAMTSAAPNPTSGSPIPVTVTFGESVSGFTASDITTSNGTVSNFAGSGASYSFELTPSGQGLVTADIAAGVAQDVAGNGNTAATQFSRTFDNVGPSVAFSSAAPDPTNVSPIPVMVTFSESVSGFTVSDITTNGTVVNFTGSGTTYTFDLTPTGQGLVTADIAAGIAQDAAGNGNTAAIQFSRTFDSASPSVAFSSAAPDPTNTSPIPVTVTFSESMSGFTAADITTANGTVSNFAGSGGSYTFDLVPAGQGLVTADIAPGVAQEAAGNGNTVAAQFSRTYDSLVPTVTINQAASQADPTGGAPINFTVVFNEPVTGFGDTTSDVTISGTAGATTATVTGSGTTYNVAITGMTGTGTVVVTLLAGTAQDLATNPNAASTSTDNTVDFDPVVPVVTGIVRADPSPTNAQSVQFTVTFSKSVTGVDASDFDLILSGVSGASVTGVGGSGTTWTVTVDTGTDDGNLRLDLVDDDSITDTAGNPLGGSGAGNGDFTAGQVYTIDKTAPSVSAIVRAGVNPTNAASVDFMVTFSEVVVGVEASDFTLATSGVSGASVTGVSGNGTTWTVTVDTGTGDGTIRLDLVDDDTIVDVIGNQLGGAGAGNGSFTSGEVYTIDKTAPQADSLVAADVSTAGGTSYSFTVEYSDNLAVDIASLDASDIRVSGPNGFSQLATLVSVTPPTNGTPRTATYQISAPGGTWDNADTGTYTISLEADQVADTVGNLANSSAPGTFQVNIAPTGYAIFLPMVLGQPGMPDLVVSTSISPNRTSFTAGEPVTVSVTVTNQGSAPAGPFWVDLYLNPSSPPTAANQLWNTRCALTPCFGVAWGVVGGLAPGQSITLSSQSVTAGHSNWLGWFAAGTTDLYVYADSYNAGVATGAVAESNEANNRAELRGLSVSGANPPVSGAQAQLQLLTRPPVSAR